MADLERNSKEYAAGCFHLSAQTESIDLGKGPGRSHESDDDGNEDQKLTDLDVIHECKLGEKEALRIFKRVADLSEEIDLDATKRAKKRKISNVNKQKKNQEGDGIMSEQVGLVESKTSQGQQQPPAFVPSVGFKRWKMSVLGTVKEEARAMLHSTKGRTLERISDDVALEYAAFDALKYWVD
uniref:Uncharacterized protein n=1 Tax=Pseudictyota dubia TaxID=2749911 RepID=A0A7R9VSQ8_9STRA